MSTRHARVADKELNDKHTRILIELLRRIENKTCADCKKKDPRWASWNLGIFVCIRCSGTHRSLGTHISKVKSVDLDTWTVEQIENMIKWGNQRANIYWEANLDGKQPTDSNMDSWIRAKYEQRLWVKNDDCSDLSKIAVNFVEEQKQDAVAIEEQKPVITPVVKDLSKEFGLLYHNSIKNRSDEKKEEKKGINSPVTKASVKQQNQTSTYTTSHKKVDLPTTTTSTGFKMDMSSFQQQLSGLSLGRPSSGLIPQAPPGSNTSWTNFLVNPNGNSSDATEGSSLTGK